MDVSEYPKELWQKAEHRALVISELAMIPMCSNASAERAAAELGLSVRHVYRLIEPQKFNLIFSFFGLLQFSDPAPQLTNFKK